MTTVPYLIYIGCDLVTGARVPFPRIWHLLRLRCQRIRTSFANLIGFAAVSTARLRNGTPRAGRYIWWHLTHFYFPMEQLAPDQNGVKDLHGE
jgi:hypothetical protein